MESQKLDMAQNMVRIITPFYSSRQFVPVSATKEHPFLYPVYMSRPRGLSSMTLVPLLLKNDNPCAIGWVQMCKMDK